MEEKQPNSSNVLPKVITAICVLALVGVGSYYAGTRGLFGGSGRPVGMRSGFSGSMGGMNMSKLNPPQLSDQQTAQLALGPDPKLTDKTFNITGGNFYFVPSQITVNKGDKVTLVMTNAGGTHDLIIDEFGVKTPQIKTAEAATVTFTADQSGTFEYYCDLPGHREKGMAGTLTVN